jgi:hypothetical protein
VEWGIGGLKRKWRRFMKRFDNTKTRYSHLFKSRVLFINFLPRRRMDFTYEVIGDQLPNLENQEWDKDL